MGDTARQVLPVRLKLARYWLRLHGMSLTLVVRPVKVLRPGVAHRDREAGGGARCDAGALYALAMLAPLCGDHAAGHARDGSPPALGVSVVLVRLPAAVAVTSRLTLTIAPAGMVTLPDRTLPVRLKLAMLAAPLHALLVGLAALAVKLARQGCP